MVKLPEDILLKIAEFICGDNSDVFPYRTGRDLSIFFQSVELPYSHNGSTRKWWTLEVLKQINTNIEGGLPSRELARVIEYIVAPHNSDYPDQQLNQIIDINQLIKQFRLGLAFVDEENNVVLFYHNKATHHPEHYEGKITIIADKIRRISSDKKKKSEENVENKIEETNLRKKIKKFDPQLKRFIFRASIWRAYNRKCHYCGDLISRLENMEVDHIIPQKYKKNPEDFEEIKRTYDLPTDFNIEAYYNKAPSHKGCNLKKLEHLYQKPATLFYIEEARLKIPKIEEYEKKFRDNISISDELVEGEINAEKLRNFFKRMGVSFEKEPIQIEVINERALQEHLNSFNNHLEIIRQKDPKAFEWRYYKIREEARKVFNYWDKINVVLSVVDNLIILMDVFVKEENKTLQNWGIDILNLLTKAPTLLKIIKKKSYEQLISLYEPSTLNQQLVDLLDKCDYFPDDTIPEIIDLIKNQYVKPLTCFKDRLYNKKFIISRDKAQSYIDEITLATMDLEPRTNQTHNTIVHYTNEVKELLNKID